MRKILFILLAITVFSCKKENEETTTPSKPAPVANFTFSGDNKPAPCEVTFTNSSTNSTTYSWEFGDGATSTEQNPKHKYTTGGTFTAKLTSTGAGGTNSITKSVVIQNPLANAPVANFTFTGDNQPAPCEITFTNTSTNATTYSWEFGDGATSTEQNPKHTYTTGGTFTAKLTSTGTGGTNSITKSIVIQNPVAAPVANFTFTGANNFAPSNVTFTNTSTNAVSYSWDFGDGQTSTLQNPSHVYTSGGTYNVTLTAKNSINTQNVINKTVVIKNAPTKLKIKKITVTTMPFTNNAGVSWDSGSGPDVYFKITDVNNSVFYNGNTSVIDNLTPTGLPIAWNFNTPFEITNLSISRYFDLWDEDTINDELIGYVGFTMNDYTTGSDPYPLTITKTNNSGNGNITITLNVEWVE